MILGSTYPVLSESSSVVVGSGTGTGSFVVVVVGASVVVVLSEDSSEVVVGVGGLELVGTLELYDGGLPGSDPVGVAVGSSVDGTVVVGSAGEPLVGSDGDGTEEEPDGSELLPMGGMRGPVGSDGIGRVGKVGKRSVIVGKGRSIPSSVVVWVGLSVSVPLDG